MKSFIALSTIFGALAFTSAGYAQVTTDPVGYVSLVTPNGDDSLFGISLTKTPVYTGTASQVNSNVITVSADLVADEFNLTHYLLSDSGQWSTITDNTTNTITTQDIIISQNDNFKVIEFWTLSTLFPGGSGVGVSNDPNLPSATVLINNLSAEGTDLSSSASYFYFVGAEGVPAGWYQTGVFTPSDNFQLSPETYITIRNQTGDNVNTVVSGTVPTSVVGTTVLRAASFEQDNQLTNPYPAPFTLASSGLAQVVSPASDPNIPEDTVLIYDIENTDGQDISTAASYFYFAGAQGVPAGWYQTGNFTPSDSVAIPAGGAFLVRKGAGEEETLEWNPPVPYSLNN